MNRPATPAVQHGNGLHRHEVGEVGRDDWDAWARWQEPEGDGPSDPAPPTPPPPASARHEPDTAAYDTLADLFLGETAAALPFDTRPTIVPPRREVELPPGGPLQAAPAGARVHAPAAPPPAPPTSPTIELLILGHLPVLASTWASQYARHAAEMRAAPVGVLRLDHETVVLEVIGAEPSTAALTGDARRIPFEDAVARAAELAAMSGGRADDAAPVWILRAGPLDEPGLIDRACVGVVTVLTGADEAALVGAYRTVKSILPRLQRREEAGHAPGLRIVLMGAPEGKAGPAAAKLAEAVRTFLGRTIGVEIGPERIGSTHPPLLLHERPREAGINAAVEAFERALTDAGTPRMSRLGGESWGHGGGTPRMSGALTANPGVSAHGRVSAQGPQDSASPPKQASSWACQSASSTLARFIAGLTPLHIRCPYARSVELAIDRAGTIHLLASEVRGTDEDNDRTAADAEAPALGLLLSAAAWANVHAPLIRSTLGAESPAPSIPHIPSVPHLFVAHPSAARRLLETDVRLHLLASVQVEGKPGWYSTELN